VEKHPSKNQKILPIVPLGTAKTTDSKKRISETNSI
jgi:hypothetical protein